MSTSKTKNCIFCQLVAREIPAEIVYEDEDFLAFLDIEPIAPGHVQVIPKQHYRFVWNVPNVGPYFEVVKKIALAQQQVFATDFILSKIVGEEVPHAHIWVYPDPDLKLNKQDFSTYCKLLKTKL